MRAGWIAAIAIGGSCGSSPPSPRPAPPPPPYAPKMPPPAGAVGTVQETVLGKLDSDLALPFVFSPRGDRAAAIVHVGNQPGYGQPHVTIGMYVVVVSAAGAERSEAFSSVSNPEFSPDGSRFIYAAVDAESRAYVVTDDGRQGPFSDVSYPGFSPRGHLVFTAREQGERRERLVVDGRSGPVLDQAERPIFSPDGSRVAYLAQRGRSWHVVVDDEIGPAFDEVGIPRFSADGARVGYAARRDDRSVLVVDGAVRTLPEGARIAALGPSLDRLLYETEGGRKRTLYLDGRVVASWDDVINRVSPVFAPNGEAFAFVEARNGKAVAVVADMSGRRLHEGRQFRWIEQLSFAPRGAVLVYRGCDDGQCRMMWGDRESPWATGMSEPVISPDGRTLAYFAGHASKGVSLVVGEQAYGPYEQVGNLMFSPDGRRLAWGAQRGRELRWYVIAIAPTAARCESSHRASAGDVSVCSRVPDRHHGLEGELSMHRTERVAHGPGGGA